MKKCITCGDTARGEEILMGDDVIAWGNGRQVHGWACNDCLHGKYLEEAE